MKSYDSMKSLCEKYNSALQTILTVSQMDVNHCLMIVIDAGKGTTSRTGQSISRPSQTHPYSTHRADGLFFEQLLTMILFS